MPYNDEQVSIVEKLETNDGVVVQGPPGTGKTHTIANVISHFLAQGKRVLVTAKGESALAVLQEKLPEQIRPLSVALLSDERDGMKQFEHSIQTIASSVNTLNPGQAARNITALEDRLTALHAKIASVDQSIKVFADKHMKRYTFHGRETSPEELAKFVMENTELYGWLADELNSKNVPQFSDNDVKALCQSRIEVGSDLEYIESTLPVPDSFPVWPALLALHKDIIRAKDIDAGVTLGDILAVVDSTQDTFSEARQFAEFLDKRAELKSEIAKVTFAWSPEFQLRLLEVGEDDSAFQLLWILLKDIEALEAHRKELLAIAAVVPLNAELDQDFMRALERLTEGKSAFVLPFGKQDARALVASITVRG